VPSTRRPTWRGLYAIVDPAFCRGRDPRWVAAAILDGGCGALQLRAKHTAPAELESLARELRALCHARGVPFVVNDWVELALRVGADGVHLGQTDMPIEAARALGGNALAIGLSTHDLEQARAAAACGADLIGFGPVFATASKLDPEPVTGVPALRAAREAVAIPVVAIGGVTPENAADVASAGAAMAAAISALGMADDPRAVAYSMHAALVADGA
jgi:thiamine-phosphate pyrophosphorylase